MNSTISTDIKLNEEYFVPFWILLEFLDTAPPEPFVSVKVIAIEAKNATSPDGPVQVPCCDLLCGGKKQLVAHNIPAEYLIPPEDLQTWADDIADWFRKFGENYESSRSDS